jgi:hypothetical protein
MRIRASFFDAFRKQGPPLKSKSWARRFFCLAVLAAIPCTIGNSQQSASAGENPPRSPSGIPPISPLANRTPDSNRIMEDSMQTPESRKRLEQLNLLRQKEMTEDTARLVRLANEVKAETGKGTADSLTVVELRKVELIAKLAKSVRDKMKATVGN